MRLDPMRRIEVELAALLLLLAFLTGVLLNG
jgi:hypothetical protein